MPDLDLEITDSRSKEHEILDDCDALLYQSPYPPVTLLCNVDDPQEASEKCQTYKLCTRMLTHTLTFVRRKCATLSSRVWLQS